MGSPLIKLSMRGVGWIMILNRTQMDIVAIKPTCHPNHLSPPSLGYPQHHPLRNLKGGGDCFLH